MPKVMLVCERLDLSGGVERFVCETAAWLSTQGFSAVVGSVDTPRDRIPYALPDAVGVACGAPLPAAAPPAGRLGRAWALARRQWRVGRRLAALIREQRPDVVVLNGLTTAASTLLADRALAARSICCDHNHFGARSRPWQWLRRRLYPRVAAVVSLTAADRPRFAALNPRTEVIANASSLWAEAPAPAVAAPLDAVPRVLAVGRHVAQKGLDLLLEAWAVVHAARPTARLRIVGDGPLQDDLQARARALGVAASVDWVAPTAAVVDEYRAAAVFVLPSRYEGMPLALLEAQALGLPAVAFDCPTGPRDILAADTGLLVAAGDCAALAAALLQLLDDPARRAAMGAAAIARSRRLFSPEGHREAWRRLVADTAARVPPWPAAA